MWRYTDLLSIDLQILLLLALGALCVYTKTFNQHQDLNTLNRFVFHILLPASVLLGLGLKSDLRDGTLWRFIGAFIMMRAICLAACAALFGGGLRRGLGEVTMSWLCVSWVSTVILGVPLVKATLGAQYANLGVVAGISSFVFQLPLMLVLMEINSARREGSLPDRASEGASLPPDGTAAAAAGDSKDVHGVSSTFRAPMLPSRRQLAAVGGRLVRNPILWSILAGLILSLTKLGPKYLNPGNPPTQPNCSYAPGAGFINVLLSSLAACTEPVALFATGIFLVHRNPLACGAWQALLFMLAKLVLVPALMAGCAAAVGLEGATARAAVLLASLPISSAAFAFAGTYGVGEDIATSNIFFGNLLVLPTTILWFVFMDGVGLFPTPEPAVPSVCAAAPPVPRGL